MQGKKWMMIVTDDQVKWLQAVSEKTGLKGSDIGREAIFNAMNDKSFVSSLTTVQYKLQLEELARKRDEIENKEEEIKKRLKQERVAI